MSRTIFSHCPAQQPEISITIIDLPTAPCIENRHVCVHMFEKEKVLDRMDEAHDLSHIPMVQTTLKDEAE